MKTKKFCKILMLIIAFISVSITACSESKFKKINDKGEANFIFASKPIPKGKEDSVKLKTSFSENDEIYARGYFPEKIGSCKDGEAVYVEMWIDGKRKFQGTYENVDQSWDQMSIYMRNTGDDDFDGAMKKELEYLNKGEHDVILYFFRTHFDGYEKKINDQGKIVKTKIFKTTYLTKGVFTYIK